MNSLPEEVLENGVVPFLTTADLIHLSWTTKTSYAMFRPMVFRHFRASLVCITHLDLGVITPSKISGSLILQALHGLVWTDSNMDIFTTSSEFDTIVARLRSVGAYPASGGPCDDAVYPWQWLDHKIDLVEVENVDTAIGDFDLGMCKNSYDGKTLSIAFPFQTLSMQFSTYPDGYLAYFHLVETAWMGMDSHDQNEIELCLDRFSEGNLWSESCKIIMSPLYQSLSRAKTQLSYHERFEWVHGRIHLHRRIEKYRSRGFMCDLPRNRLFLLFHLVWHG